MAGAAANQELAVLERNFWIALVESGLKRWQDMEADWDGSKACPPFDIVSPRSSKPQRKALAFYKGEFPEGWDGPKSPDGKKDMGWGHCVTDSMKAVRSWTRSPSSWARRWARATADA